MIENTANFHKNLENETSDLLNVILIFQFSIESPEERSFG